MAPASSSSIKKSIRPHRKSRTGCSSCKRRKVKCDEEKPCSNCIRFGLPCDLAPESARIDHGIAPAAQRGRGRPRKAWTQPAPTHLASTASPPPPPPTIDINQAELLLHFTTTAAPTLGGCECPHQLAFWTRNVPHIGLSHPFVLHLLLAAAAFHLAYRAKHHTTTDTAVDDAAASALPLRLTRVEYLALAQQHLTAGVSGFSAQLGRPAPENCGALYLGAVLTCYCTFADGPRGNDDLLVCTVKGEADGVGGLHDEGSRRGEDASPAAAGSSSSSSPTVSMPFVYGVRLMHESFSPDVLFAGPMEPLARAPRPPPLEQPVYARDGFPRLEWEAQLDGLREFVAAARCGASDGHEDATRASGEVTRATAAVSLKALDNLIGIYAAIYGRRGQNGEITLDGPSENQFVFGWLYRLEPEFAACVKRCEPCALLALAHYALLLNGDAVPRGWYVEGWREHIVARIGELLGDAEGSEWMRWPLEQVAVKERGQSRLGS